ncbi:MAG: glycosyltransferase family 4 protein [Ignavibacteria bacterium]|nr:glycosyltransferase family 4 protein [Ignavibacteria bacterium]
MINKAIVAHSGARDNYQIANILYQHGYLDKLVTDIIITKRFSNLMHVNRSNDILPLSMVNMPIKAILKLAQGLLSRDRLHYSGQIGNILSITAYNIAKKHKSNLFLYHYDAYEAFNLAINDSFPGKRILFQVHPHPKSIINILNTEIERVPFAKNSILNEFEFKFGTDYTDKLSAVSNMADRIIVSSEFSRKTLMENGIPSSKINVIPYGVDTKVYPFKQKTNTELPIKLIFIGSMIQRKGLADLLLAVELLNTNKIQLTICGRGQYDENLLKRFSHLRNIKIKRNLSHFELINEMHQSDIFVLPSLIEGFAHVILEAMSTGLPIITTANTCGPDVIRDEFDGLICDIKNPTSIAEKIEWFIQNITNLPDMGKSASERSSYYSWKLFNNNIIKFYESM